MSDEQLYQCVVCGGVWPLKRTWDPGLRRHICGDVNCEANCIPHAPVKREKKPAKVQPPDPDVDFGPGTDTETT